jgi:hypothetical protein
MNTEEKWNFISIWQMHDLTYRDPDTRFSASCFFFVKQLPLGPWYTGLSLFEYGFEFAEKIDYEIADFCHSGFIDDP